MGSTIWKDVVANVATTVDKVVPWFAGWASPWSLLAEATSIASARAPMAELGVGSADGPIFLMLPRSRGAIGRVRATPGALPTAGRSTDGLDARVDDTPAREGG